MKKNAVIFDLFGTLVKPTSPELAIIKKWQLPTTKHKELQKVVCGTKFKGNYKNYYNLILKAGGIPRNDENRKKLENMFNSQLKKGAILPQTKEILGELKKKGYKIGLISNAYPRTRKEILEKNNLIKYFDTIFLSYEIGMTKQTPEYYSAILKKMEIDAKNTIMVGDSFESDIKMSKKATNGEIGGILISKKNKELNLDRLLIVSNLTYILDFIEKYFSNPIAK